MGATDNRESGASYAAGVLADVEDADRIGAADDGEDGFDTVVQFVERVKADAEPWAEQESRHLAEAQRQVELAKRAAEYRRFIKQRAHRAVKVLLAGDHAGSLRILAEEPWDGLLGEHVPGVWAGGKARSDEELVAWMLRQAAEAPKQAEYGWAKVGDLPMFRGPGEVPKLIGDEAVRAVRRVLNIPYPAEKPAKKKPAAKPQPKPQPQVRAAPPVPDSTPAATARWNGWKGSARRLLGEKYTADAEHFLRRECEAGTRPADAVSAWLKVLAELAEQHNPNPIPLEKFGGGAYTRDDLHGALSMASVKATGLVRRVLEHDAAAWAVIEVQLPSGEPGGLPAGVERYTLYRLVPPAHWKHPGKVNGYVGREVRDPEPRTWFVGREVIEVDVRGEGAGEE